MQPRKSKARVIGAIAAVLILVGAAGTHFFILAPEMSLVTSSVEGPLPTSSIMTTWQYNFTVIVGNSGFLAGKATVFCSVSFDAALNDTQDLKSYEGTATVEVGGGNQTSIVVYVYLPWTYAIISMVANKTWDVRLV